MARNPAKWCALLPVGWIVLVVILLTVGLPHTTLPTRNSLGILGLMIVGFAALTNWVLAMICACRHLTREQHLASRPSTSIDLTCSRLC